MLSDLSLITNNLATTFSIVAFLFTVYHWRVYRWCIVIPFLLTISSITYGIIDKDINDILYDIAYLYVVFQLIAGRVRLQKSKDFDNCSHCGIVDCNNRSV